MSDVAVSIKNVKKAFHLPRDNYDSIKLKILNSFKKREKGYTEYQALKGIDLDIKKGEFIGILGRNGAGKSTLLKIIAEIYQPSSGSVKVNGRLVPFIELGVGFNKNLSGRDNVYLNGAMLGFSRAEIDEMYESIVDFAELHEFMDQKIKNYSSGMKVRLAFSIAIKADADILLLDEVLAVGDAAFKRKCYDYFNDLKKAKKTIILVTHNMSAARDYCDRAVLIEDGKVVFDGTPDEATDQYFQLFNVKEQGIQNGEVILDDVTVNVNGSKVLFKVDLTNKTQKIFSDIMVRIAVKKQNGRVIAGFDNKNLDEPFPIDLRAKESRTLLFEAPNIISDGSYSVNAAIYGGDLRDYEDDEDEITDAILFDRKVNIASFMVKRPGTKGPILLPVKVTKHKE